MSVYLDTSLLVASVSSEASAARVQEWMRTARGGFAVSDWSLAEFASAVGNKHRAGTMSAEQRADAIRWFNAFASEVALLLPVERTAFRRAAELSDRGDIKIRAGDALHLAIAEANAMTVCTLDQDQATAGTSAGIATLIV